ncbi:MAG: hypothetical protein II992_07570, partial [Lachnospiraceae bacterium]|nr:hypothetical protein [Lachnospiraceae bacterium]
LILAKKVMPAKRKIKINTHFFGGKHKCALPVWITWKGLRKNVKIIHIVKKAGYKIGLPFGTVWTPAILHSVWDALGFLI